MSEHSGDRTGEAPSGTRSFAALRINSDRIHSDFLLALIALLFLAPRIILLFVREPFFDELFTLWITRRTFGGIVDALRADSGPPLYYLAVRALGIGTVGAARALSLSCAAVSFAAILSARWIGRARFTAAALLAVFPPAVLFSVDARAYAMCAMFLTLAVLLGDRGRPLLAALALVAAAYAHYYGALFFPILLIPAGGAARRPEWRVRAAAAGLAGLLFLPGVLLASRQPSEAVAWMGFPPRWPEALWPQPPMSLVLIGLVLLAAAAFRVNRFTSACCVAVAAALALATLGRPVYFPLRFEAVLAPPLALAVALSLERWPLLPSRVLVAAMVLAGVALTSLGVVDHARRDPDDYRAAARWAAAHVPESETLVASGYLYLETVMTGRAGVRAYPEEQGVHPGWRALATGEPLPRPPYYWIGERGSRELLDIRRACTTDPVYVSPRAVVLRVGSQARPVSASASRVR